MKLTAHLNNRNIPIRKTHLANNKKCLLHSPVHAVETLAGRLGVGHVDRAPIGRAADGLAALVSAQVT